MNRQETKNLGGENLLRPINKLFVAASLSFALYSYSTLGSHVVHGEETVHSDDSHDDVLNEEGVDGDLGDVNTLSPETSLSNPNQGVNDPNEPKGHVDDKDLNKVPDSSNFSTDSQNHDPKVLSSGNTNRQLSSYSSKSSGQKKSGLNTKTPANEKTNDVVSKTFDDDLNSLENTPSSKENKILQDSQVDFTFTKEDYKQATALELAELVRSEKISSKELIDIAYEIIEETDPLYDNIVSLTKEQAYAKAEALEDSGQPFLGVPLLVKGLGHTLEGAENTNGLVSRSGTIANRDGRHVRELEKAGFITIGSTTFPQFGWINVTNSELYGSTKNPWNPLHNPGGSSGGSAAAITAGQVPIATSSDAGGSTRIPAAWSGLIGLHPSRKSLSWDTSNPNSQTSHFALTKDMNDLIALHDFLLDIELNEVELTPDTPIAYTTQTPAGTPISDDAVLAVKEAVTFLNNLGYTTLEVDYPIDGEFLMHQYYTIAAFGAPKLPQEEVELLTWGLAQAGELVTREDYNAAWEYAHQAADKMTAFFNEYPIFLTPTNAWPAPEHDYFHMPEELQAQMEDMSDLNKEERLQLIYNQWLPAWTLTPYTQLSNLTGAPSISLPTYVTENHLPMGIMFSTDRYNDNYLLQLGLLFEEHQMFKLIDDYSPEEVGESDEPELNETSHEEQYEKNNQSNELIKYVADKKTSSCNQSTHNCTLEFPRAKQTKVDRDTEIPINVKRTVVKTDSSDQGVSTNNTTSETLPNTSTLSWLLALLGIGNTTAGLLLFKRK